MLGPTTIWTQKEIEKIIHHGESTSAKEGEVTSVGNPIDYNRRVTDISWIEPEEDTFWLFRKMDQLFFRTWKINRIATMQYTVYRPGGFFNWHNDNSLNPGQPWVNCPGSNRVASAVIQLSDPKDYDGGQLEIIHPAGPIFAPTHRGSTVAFTSSMYHKAHPVLRGIRKTLVCWALR